MLNDSEKRIIEFHDGNKKLKEWMKAIKESNNPFFLKESAETYNWDDGFELPLIAANNPCCDKGTALNLFWLAEGIVLFNGEVERNEYNNDWADFCELVGKRLINGFYKIGAVSFDPLLSKIMTYKYKKSEIPLELYEPVNGNKCR